MDAIFIATVFVEIADREAFHAEALRVLKSGGALSISEHHPDSDCEPTAAGTDEARRRGFEPGTRMGWRWAFTLNATKEVAERARPARPTPGLSRGASCAVSTP